jgi:hypothetical protein
VIALDEHEQRFGATFVNRLATSAEGTSYTVDADVRLRMPRALLALPFRGLVRRRVRRFVLEPMRRAGERVARMSLLTAVIDGTKPGARVEVERIEMPADPPSGLHRRPRPVVGSVVAGPQGATFVTRYLVGPGEHELITMLD